MYFHTLKQLSGLDADIVVSTPDVPKLCTGNWRKHWLLFCGWLPFQLHLNAKYFVLLELHVLLQWEKNVVFCWAATGFTWKRPVRCNLGKKKKNSITWQGQEFNAENFQKNHYIVEKGLSFNGKKTIQWPALFRKKQKQACITQRATSPLSHINPPHCLPITSNVHLSVAWPQHGSPSAQARQSTRSSGPPI